MAEAAAATSTPAGAPPPSAPPPAAPSQSAGATLTTPPQVNTQAANWFGDFKNEELKSYVQEKKFTGPEQLVERYKNLESLRGVPEDRLLKLPEKMDGPEAKVIWEKLGTPKDPKGYEFVEEGQDPQMLGWAKETFFKNNLTKAQGQELIKSYNEMMTKALGAQAEARKNAIAQSDAKLQKEWGAEYDANLNIARQGARILGLDAKTLDVIEALQGRDSLFKKLKEVGAALGESNFVDGQQQASTTLTQEQALAEIASLKNDQKFAKKLFKGDPEARARLENLNKMAYPGEKQIG